MSTQVFYTIYDSPVGGLLLAGTTRALHVLAFPTGPRVRHPQKDWKRDAAPFAEVASQLDDYFAGKRETFDVPLHLNGTDFQKQVWRALPDIAFGETISYGELARRIGRPKASRAIGAANGANNISIILPCHRVIGANKSLTGFGGGLAAKEFLLRHEQHHSPHTNHQPGLFAQA